MDEIEDLQLDGRASTTSSTLASDRDDAESLADSKDTDSALNPFEVRRFVLKDNGVHVSYSSAENCHPKITAFVKQLADGKYQDEDTFDALAEEASKVKHLESLLKQLSDEEVERVRNAAVRAIDKNEFLFLTHHVATAAFLPQTVADGALRCDERCLWPRKYCPQKREAANYHVPAPRPARMFGYDFDILFNGKEERKAAMFIWPGTEFAKHVRCGSIETWFPFMVMETKSACTSSHYEAVNQLAAAGSFGTEMIDRLFRRAAVYLDDAGDFPDPLSTLSFGYTVTAESVGLWYTFIGSEEDEGKNERAYYTHHIQSFLLLSRREIRAFYATILRILVLAFTTRLEDIKKALRVLTLSEQRPKHPNLHENQGLSMARGIKRQAGSEIPEGEPGAKRINDGLKSCIFASRGDPEAMDEA